MKTYRDNGAIGAFLDEYEKAVNELQSLIEPINNKTLTTVVDTETDDKDCRSIQTILTHVISAGYAYIIYLRKDLGQELDFRQKLKLDSVQEYIDALDEMFQFNEQFFIDHPLYKLEESDLDKKILTNWGQRYDGEQMLEHAIVHILRHRRQVERFLLKF